MNVRYSLCPQMQYYDNLSFDWHPYVMFMSNTNFVSDIVNTDNFGFRKSIYKGKNVSITNCQEYDKVSLVIGGSSAFGVGATSDAKTLPSIIGKKSSHPWINFGGRAYNSTQEIILLTRYLSKLPKIANIVVFSGLNNLYLSKNAENVFPPFFFSDYYHKRMILSRRKRIKNTLQEVKTRIRQSVEIESSFDVESSLEATLEDLFVLRELSKALNFKLFYVLQPFAPWFKDSLTGEEKEIFGYLDLVDKRSLLWKNLQNLSIYDLYRSSLSKYCKMNDIGFLNLNENLNIADWLFVDRIHMTDLGYEKSASQISLLVGMD